MTNNLDVVNLKRKVAKLEKLLERALAKIESLERSRDEDRGWI